MVSQKTSTPEVWMEVTVQRQEGSGCLHWVGPVPCVIGAQPWQVTVAIEGAKHPHQAPYASARHPGDRVRGWEQNSGSMLQSSDAALVCVK